MTEMFKKFVREYSKWILLASLSCLAYWIYRNTFGVGFYFDASGIHGDKTVEDLTLALNYGGGNRRLTYISYAINYFLGEYEPWGWHIMNLAFHVMTSFLIYRFVFLLFETKPMQCLKTHQGFTACMAALIFLCHPVQTQPVIYLYQRTTLLAALFYVAGCASYVRARLSGSFRFYGLTALVVYLAFFTKSITITIPITFLFLEFMFFSSHKLLAPKRIVLLTVIGLSMGIVPLLWNTGDMQIPWWQKMEGSASYMMTAFREGGIQSAVGSIANFLDHIYPTPPYIEFSRWQYSLTQVTVFNTYLRLFIWPAKQMIDYDYGIVANLWQLKLWWSFFVLTAMMLVGFLSYQKKRLLSFCIFWFFIVLSVEFVAVRDVIYEHRAYLPSVGLCMGFAFSMSLVLKKPFLKIVLATLLIVILCITSSNRASVWKNEVGLWKDVTQKAPKRGRAFSNLGAALDKEGRKEEAVEAFKKAIPLGPPATSILSMSNIGIILIQLGRIDEGLEYCHQASRHAPNYGRHYFIMGYAYDKKNMMKESIHYYTKATEEPLWGEAFQWQAHHALAQIYMRSKQSDKVDFHIKSALALHQGSPRLHRTAGHFAETQGRKDDALQHYKIAQQQGDTDQPLLDAILRVS